MTLYLGKQQVAMTMNHVDESAVAQKVDKVTTPNIVYGTDSNGDQTTYDKNSFGQVDDVKVNGTSVVDNKVASITLGTMASENTTSYYTKTELDGKLNSAMHFKGTKDRVADLPSSGQEVGDMWNVQSTGANYAWDGSSWDKLSEIIDLSGLQPNLTSSNAGTGISITGSGSNVVISNTQTSAEWGNITGTLSNQTDLNNALNDKANDSDVVKLTGDQTIGGYKTFNNNMLTKNIYPRGNITLGTSTNTWGHMVQFQDTAGKRIARVQPMAIDTTKNRMGMWVNNADNTVEKGIEIWSDGTTVAPTPETSDNSTKIATTAFVKNQGYLTSHQSLSNYVTLNSNQTITGIKSIAPFYVLKENSDKEGGQIHFDSADNEPNAGKNMWFDRYNGCFRFVGSDSNSVTRVPLQIDIQNNKVISVTPATSDNSTQIATTAFVVNVLNTIYPVGSLFFSTASTCPLQAFGIGTWKNVGTSLTLSVNTDVPVKGNGMTLGVTKDGTTTNTLVGHYGSWSGVGGTNLFVDNYNSAIGSGQSHTNVPGAIGITTDSSKSGIVGTVTRTQITVNVFQRTA